MYLRLREIFAVAADYSPVLPETTQFFPFIQNKLHSRSPARPPPNWLLSALTAIAGIWA